MCKVGLNDLWRLFLFLGQAGVALRVLRLSKVQPLLRFSDLYNIFPSDKIDTVRLALMPHTCADLQARIWARKFQPYLLALANCYAFMQHQTTLAMQLQCMGALPGFYATGPWITLTLVW